MLIGRHAAVQQPAQHRIRQLELPALHVLGAQLFQIGVVQRACLLIVQDDRKDLAVFHADPG